MRQRTTGYANFDSNIDTPSHTHAHTRLCEHPPPYIRWWALAFKRETTIFRFVCRAEVHIATEKCLQFWHLQQNPWLGPRGCVRESTMLQLVGAVSSLHFFHAIHTMTTVIRIHQYCVLPSEEQLTGSQDSSSWRHNRLLSLGIGIWLTPPMAWAGEWLFGRSSGHGMVWLCLLSAVFCLFSVSFLWLSVWRTW